MQPKLRPLSLLFLCQYLKIENGVLPFHLWIMKMSFFFFNLCGWNIKPHLISTNKLTLFNPYHSNATKVEGIITIVSLSVFEDWKWGVAIPFVNNEDVFFFFNLCGWNIKPHLNGLFGADPQPINSSPPSAAYMRQWIGPALVQIMACRLFGDKPLSKPTLGYCQLDP